MSTAILNHLWQSTVFAIVIGLMTLAFRSNRAQVRCWLWFGASMKFLIPFALLIGVGGSLGTLAPPARELTSPEVAAAVVQVSQPFLADDFSSLGLSAVAAIWVVGFCAIVAMRFRQWRLVQAAVHAGVAMKIPGLELPKNVAVRSTPGLLEPGVVGGVFGSQPILLLPQGILNYLTPSQMSAVITHELCHVRRRDNLTSALHMATETVFWFHPLVWWIGGRMLEERERACDEEVLRLGGDPHVYAEGIVNVCKRYVETPLACVSGVSGANLKKRIEDIMKNRVVVGLNTAKKIALMTAGVGALMIPLAIGMLDAPLLQAQAQTKTAAKTDPIPVYQPQPEYSEPALKARFQGQVQLSFRVDPFGVPQNIKVVRQLGLGLDEKAIETVRTWRYNPAIQNGRPVEAEIRETVVFRLPE